MMNSIIHILLFLVAWVVVFLRFRSMRWEDARKGSGIALKIWLMMVFVAIAITGVLDFAEVFDNYIANNFSRLVTYSSFLIAINLGVTVAFDTVGKKAYKPLIRWLWYLLAVAIATEGIIYIFFLSRIPEFDYYATPQSLPEITFKLILFCFETMQGLVASKILLAYLPSETSVIARIRVGMILMNIFATGIFWLVMSTIILGYFWPALVFPALIQFPRVILICTFIFLFSAFLHNKIYARLLLLTRSFEHWRAFQDLQSLVRRLLLLCPVIGMPAEYPNFWRFVFDPEYYLYRAVIIILDSKAMLVDFLAEVEKPGMGGLWEPDEQAEAARISAALEAANPSNDFSDIVETYRRVSRELFENQKGALAKIS